MAMVEKVGVRLVLERRALKRRSQSETSTLKTRKRINIHASAGNPGAAGEGVEAAQQSAVARILTFRTRAERSPVALAFRC
jgi:hypothetical protein